MGLSLTKETPYEFKVERKVAMIGMMLVGWGGNNGTIVTAGILANRRNLSWDTKDGPRQSNYDGSVIMGSTLKLGADVKTSKDINIPFACFGYSIHDCGPETKYSPAKILSFLIAHKHSSRDAVENVMQWIEKGGEEFVSFRRQTSTMTKNEEMVNVSAEVSAGVGIEDNQ